MATQGAGAAHHRRQLCTAALTDSTGSIMHITADCCMIIRIVVSWLTWLQAHHRCERVQDSQSLPVPPAASQLRRPHCWRPCAETRSPAGCTGTHTTGATAGVSHHVLRPGNPGM